MPRKVGRAGLPAAGLAPEIAYKKHHEDSVIEDDRVAAEYLEKALAEHGHTAHTAGDGETGFLLAADGEYDVLIVDRMLPRRDGLSVIAGLRSRGNTTPVLILSALGEVDDRHRACGQAAMIISQSLMPFPNCWRASKG